MKWKRKTYRRDLMCLCCGEDEKCKLTIHHILPKSLYPELIAEETNLITLCQACHEFLHEVVCDGDNGKCNLETLKMLFHFKGTLRGKRARKKAKHRKW